MKYFFTLIILFSIPSMNHAQSFDLTFNHYAINVENLETSVEFYENVMVLKQIPNETNKEHIRWFGIGNELELHVIQSETKNISLVKGVHLSLALSNLDAFIKHLDTLNIPYENWQGESNKTNVRPDGVTQIYLQDPDGYWIEVNDDISND